jgi:hypothetical protein
MELIIHLEQEDWKKKDIVVEDIANYTFYPATYSGCKITFEIVLPMKPTTHLSSKK